MDVLGYNTLKPQRYSSVDDTYQKDERNYEGYCGSCHNLTGDEEAELGEGVEAVKSADVKKISGSPISTAIYKAKTLMKSDLNKLIFASVAGFLAWKYVIKKN